MDPVERVYDAEAAIVEALREFGGANGRNLTFSGRDPEPPIIIDSGRGCQAWVRLEDIVLYNGDGDIPQLGGGWVLTRTVARRVNGYWLKYLDTRLGVCHGCRIDTSVSDLPRVMRCPGTINIKTGRPTKLIHATDRVYNGLARIMSTIPKKYLVDPEPTEGVAPGQPWQMVVPHLTRMAQDYVSRGQEEPGRHKVMWHTAKKFQELGVSRVEARKALMWANRLRGEDSALPPDQIKHALDTAYQGA